MTEAPSETEQGSSRFRQIFKGLVVALVVSMTSGCAYNWYATRAMNREAVRLPRDQATNVVKGTEAVTLPGKGPNAVLLVHGFVGSRIDFNDLGEVLNNQGLTVRLMRLPGHGTYPADYAATSNEELIEAVRNEYRELKKRHEKVALVGFSMGGALSAVVSSEEKIDRTVLISPYFGVTHRWYYGLPAETWNGMVSWAIPNVVKSRRFICVNNEEAKDELYCYTVVPTKCAAKLIRLGKRARDPSTLTRVSCPVLVLQSHGDQAASPGRTEKAFPHIGSQDKRIVWYEESNHHILWDFDKEAAKAEIVEFLGQLIEG